MRVFSAFISGDIFLWIRFFVFLFTNSTLYLCTFIYISGKYVCTYVEWVGDTMLDWYEILILLLCRIFGVCNLERFQVANSLCFVFDQLIFVHLKFYVCVICQQLLIIFDSSTLSNFVIVFLTENIWTHTILNCLAPQLASANSSAKF